MAWEFSHGQSTLTLENLQLPGRSIARPGPPSPFGWSGQAKANHSLASAGLGNQVKTMATKGWPPWYRLAMVGQVRPKPAHDWPWLALAGLEGHGGSWLAILLTSFHLVPSCVLAPPSLAFLLPGFFLPHLSSFFSNSSFCPAFVRPVLGLPFTMQAAG